MIGGRGLDERVKWGRVGKGLERVGIGVRQCRDRGSERVGTSVGYD